MGDTRIGRRNVLAVFSDPRQARAASEIGRRKFHLHASLYPVSCALRAISTLAPVATS